MLSMLDGVIDIPPGVLAALSGLLGAAALFARVVAQEGLSLSKRALNAPIGATGVVALSITVLIQPWEGREKRAYWALRGVDDPQRRYHGVKPRDQDRRRVRCRAAARAQERVLQVAPRLYKGSLLPAS
jgi:hypothetical protein